MHREISVKCRRIANLKGKGYFTRVRSLGAFTYAISARDARGPENNERQGTQTP